MVRHEETEELTIPKVDLEAYRFSPPGTMGWSAADYEKIFINQELQIRGSAPFSPPNIPDAALKERPLMDLDPTGQDTEENAGEQPNNGSETETDTDPGKKPLSKESEDDPSAAAPEDEELSAAHEEAADQDDAETEWIIAMDPPPGPWLSEHVLNQHTP